MATTEQLAADLDNVTQACAALGLARAGLYRRRQPRVLREARPRPTPERARSLAERQSVLDVLHEKRFVDLAPPQVYAKLLEEGRFLCSIRTMYRVLDAEREVKERRNIRRHPPAVKPSLVATNSALSSLAWLRENDGCRHASILGAGDPPAIPSRELSWRVGS